jgi:alkanesulfonate monooxygenase SsuD/methylene tetrahydromethanopterin reductase-like flavin-dependent oxidoreductase (luciferase family)
MTTLNLGILLWSQGATWPEMLDAAKKVDRLGYNHLWTWDHLYAIFGDPYQPIFEGWSLLNAWARETERTRLGLLVGANTFRNPGVVAKVAATLDHVSDGRAILGIGGAWMELEHQAHGIEFGSGFGQRLDWFDESVAAMRALLGGEEVTSQPGGRYAFDHLRHQPLPLQARLPIMIGGSGEKKTLRTVARYADICNVFGDDDMIRHKLDVLRRHCDDVGRDYDQIVKSRLSTLIVTESEEMGATMREAFGKMAGTQGAGGFNIGTEKEILGQLDELEEAGVEYFIFNMPMSTADGVRRAGEFLTAA